MPTCRRKRVVLVDPPQALLAAAENGAPADVYYLEQTGEIFESFEEYAARMSFYRMRQFQCEVTGKSNLTYFEALESELQEARTMHSRFPEPLKAATLSSVQFQVMGRLDHLVDAVYERFKDRYFPEERVLVDVTGDKYFAKIVAAFPPKTPAPPQPKTGEPFKLHQYAGNLKVPLKEVLEKDDPAKYLYHIQIIDEERSSDHKLSVKDREQREANRAKWSASIMEVPCSVLCRDRLAFSKSILRRFIRDCVDRDPAVASPWVVKTAIAKRYGVSTVMPEDQRKKAEEKKRSETEKRKKAWDEKEGPPTKKQKKEAAAAAAAAEAAAAEEAKKAEAERLAAEKEKEKKKKRPIRYPTEDFDVKLTDRELKGGSLLKRPVPSREALSCIFEEPHDFEAFLMTWNFLVTYGYPLHISTFTLDEFERALRHPFSDPPCSMLAEIHSCLIYNLRTVNFQRHSAVLSLVRHRDAMMAVDEVDVDDSGATKDRDGFGVSVDDLIATMGDVGNNWERVPLRHAEGRLGWEEAMFGCIKDHADLEKFPRLRQVLTQLLFAPEHDDDDDSMSSDSPPPSAAQRLSVPSTPRDRYHSLPPEDKVAIMWFMINIAVTSKAVHAHIEASEDSLTTLRKEKIELGRMKKAHAEERKALVPEGAAETPEVPTQEETVDASEALTSPSDTEGGSEAGSAAGKAAGKSKDLRRKAAGVSAKERQAARAKAKDAKQAAADLRRLEDEDARIERRLETIEREFRRLLGVTRVRPLGKDRFHNRVWWFDGLGSANLIGSGGTVLYGTGRLFIQGPSEFDVDLLHRREKEDQDVESRRKAEEGEDGMLGVGEWAVFEDPEELDQFMKWLNPKGVRELALRNTLNKWWYLIAPGLRKRTADLDVQAKIPDARRSTRTATVLNSDVSRESYMTWTNKRARDTVVQ